ncbi:MAG TPA: GNAT family N-acetyltransferase [Geminicoccaceae bacterium]|nr:GNAT family N-acetyltransferase [Geminicoccaceae bacterium]
MPLITIRKAGEADVPTILGLIHALALFENAPEAVRATAEDLRREGFGERPSFQCLLAEVDGRAAGMALWFHGFSTWTGRRSLFLEDLFVHAWARGLGVGERLMRRLAGLALEQGCARLDLAVLDWNPARGFYERLGFQPRAAWQPYRLDGDALRRLAAGEPVLSSPPEGGG